MVVKLYTNIKDIYMSNWYFICSHWYSIHVYIIYLLINTSSNWMSTKIKERSNKLVYMSLILIAQKKMSLILMLYNLATNTILSTSTYLLLEWSKLIMNQNMSLGCYVFVIERLDLIWLYLDHWYDFNVKWQKNPSPHFWIQNVILTYLKNQNGRVRPLISLGLL